MWVPGKTSSLCSKHFTVDDFERPLNMELNLKRELGKWKILKFPERRGYCLMKIHLSKPSNNNVKSNDFK